MCTKIAAISCSPLRLGRVLALMMAAPLAACGTPRALPPPVTPYDYRDRHPVVLAEAPQVLDLLPSVAGDRVDNETMGRIREFVARYRAFGHGKVTLLVPVGSESAKTTAVTAPAVRRALAAAGLGGNILVGDYTVVDTRLAAPIRLSFQSLKAKVANRCGEWPRSRLRLFARWMAE
ncbi:MAG: CpaD family pilus assembly lipoprotein [Methylocystis sp.]|uniref:CpaD family pilus assembly lipoprotein n=1 Tax=Methylocystis sp. TaxID=1911079 RepID=UPI003DA282AC